MVGDVSTTRVIVSVATYQRPRGITRLLESLDALRFEWHAPPPDVRVVVADNNPDATAADALEEYRGRWPLDVVHEPQRGIPQARNAGLEVAATNSPHFVAFLDDDEEVEAAWLDELLRVASEYEADVVAGPVISQLGGTCPPWIVRGGFFDRPRTETGQVINRRLMSSQAALSLARRRRVQVLPVVATNNALVRWDVIEDVGRFDPSLAFTGGSDREFFDRVATRGYRIVWADDAVVLEHVPRERQTLTWLIARSFRYGNNDGLRLRRREGPVREYVTTAAFAASRIAWGVLIALTGAWRGRHVAVRGLRSIAQALGTVTGMFGHAYEEYRS